MAHGANTALEIKAVLDFVQSHLSGRAIDMHEDNEGAKLLAGNPQGSHRIKHIDVRFHFLRGLVRLGQVTIYSVASAEQHADVLTKPLRREAFRRHRDFLMNLFLFHKGVGCGSWLLVSALFSLFFSPSLFFELNNQVCERTLFCWRLSLPGIYEDSLLGLATTALNVINN